MTQNYTEGYEYLSSQFPEVSGFLPGNVPE